MKIKSVLVLSLVILFVSFLGANEITVHFPEYPPYINKDQTGLLFDILDAISADTNITFTFKHTPLPRIISNFDTGLMDSYLWLTFPEGLVTHRSQEIVHLFNFTSIFLYNKSLNPELEETKYYDVNNKTLVVISGAEELFDILFPESNFEYLEVKQADQMIRIIEAGRADIADTTLLTADLLICNLFPGREDTFGYIIDKPYSGGIIFHNKVDSKLVDKIRNSYINLFNTGEIKRIISKYTTNPIIIDSIPYNY